MTVCVCVDCACVDCACVRGGYITVHVCGGYMHVYSHVASTHTCTVM